MSGDRPTSPDQLAAGREIGRSSGLEHVYVERALDAPGRTTTCPNCRTPVITREVWGAVDNRLKAGACPSCATPIAGRW
jgi:pyruvate formate lyase activating enzyme